LGVVLSDSHGQSARAMVKALIAGKRKSGHIRKGDACARNAPRWLQMLVKHRFGPAPA